MDAEVTHAKPCPHGCEASKLADVMISTSLGGGYSNGGQGRPPGVSRDPKNEAVLRRGGHSRQRGF